MTCARLYAVDAAMAWCQRKADAESRLPRQLVLIIIVARRHVLRRGALVRRRPVAVAPRIAGARDDRVARVLEAVPAALVHKHPLRLLAAFGFEAHGRARKR